MRDGNNPGALCIPKPNDERTHMNDVNWEGVYEAILLDIAHVIEGTSMPDEKLETITQLLVGNDFMEKPPLYS
jgi:hypothetical protein